MNDELYTDLVMQLFAGFYREDTFAINAVVESMMTQYEDEDTHLQEALFPGLLFASMIHMKIMLTTIEEILGLEEGEGIVKYGDFYNFFRERMISDNDLPLSPKAGGEILKDIRNDLYGDLD